jgi:hypothetical protein
MLLLYRRDLVLAAQDDVLLAWHHSAEGDDLGFRAVRRLDAPLAGIFLRLDLNLAAR